MRLPRASTWGTGVVADVRSIQAVTIATIVTMTGNVGTVTRTGAAATTGTTVIVTTMAGTVGTGVTVAAHLPAPDTHPSTEGGAATRGALLGVAAPVGTMTRRRRVRCLPPTATATLVGEATVR